jgi:hypothetical protein
MFCEAKGGYADEKNKTVSYRREHKTVFDLFDCGGTCNDC